jgi:hypothetical protein
MADEMMVSERFNSIRSEYFTSAKNFGALFWISREDRLLSFYDISRTFRQLMALQGMPTFVCFWRDL